MLKEYVGNSRKYRLKAWVKYAAAGLCTVISAVLAIGLFSAIPKKQDITQADVGKPRVMTVNLGTLGINNPNVPADENASWSGSYVYYGAYAGKPVKYRVLAAKTQEYNGPDAGADTYTMLLDCDTILFDSIYDNVVSKWESSYIKAFLNSENTAKGDFSSGGFFSKSFTDIEKNAIAPSVKLRASGCLDDVIGSFKTDEYYAPLTGEKIFLLNWDEVGRTNYGYSENIYGEAKNRIKQLAGRDACWRLRDNSEGTYPDYMVIVSSEGHSNTVGSIRSKWGISPAFNVNLDSILFVSASNVNKSSALALVDTADASGNDTWNVTLKDSDGFKASIKNVKNVNTSGAAKGSTVTVTVTDVPKTSTGEEYGQISAMLTDAAGTVLAYGKVADKAETGDIEVKLPVDVQEGKYTLRVFAETVRSTADANLTDYATNMSELGLVVTETIDKVEITGVAAPKANAELDKSAIAMCADKKIVTTTLAWKAGDTEVSGNAGYDTVYTAFVTVTATEGYVFSDTAVVTVDGKPADYIKINDDGTLTAAYTFPATEKEPEQPTEPEESTEPEQPTEPEESTEPEQPTEPEGSTEPEQSTGSEESTEPEQPTEPEESTEPDKPTEPSQPTESEQPQNEAKLELKAPTFASRTVGYAKAEENAMEIHNSGSAEAEIISVVVDNTEAFSVSGSGDSVNAGKSIDTWLLKTAEGLTADVYHGKVTVTYKTKGADDSKVKSESADIVFAVIENKIASVRITDIAEPKAGEGLDIYGACGTVGVFSANPEVVWESAEAAARTANISRVAVGASKASISRAVSGARTINVARAVTAEYNTRYTASVTLTAKEGYAFTDKTEAFVNGNKAHKVTLNQNGTLTVSYTFDATEKGRMEKPDIGVNYLGEFLTGFLDGAKYTINGNAVIPDKGMVYIDESWIGTELSIIRKSENSDYDDSEPCVLKLPERPAAPVVAGVGETVYRAGDGRITGTDIQMEYRLKMAGGWKSCHGETVDNLQFGIYEVRLKATAASFAGKTAYVEIKPGENVENKPSDTPDDNTKPTEGSNVQIQEKPADKAPATGDDTSLMVPALLLLLSCLVFAGAAFNKARNI